MPRRKPPRKKPDVGDLLNRFAAEENAFLQREFLAPALRGGVVGVRIGGVHCRIRIDPARFEGWGIFQPVSHKEAKLVRQATLSERRSYLELFPLFRQIVCRRAGNTWFGCAASFGDSRLRMEGLAPLQLAEELQLFDCVRSRYDGSRFWFDEADMRHDPGTAAYLRSALNDLTSPDDIQRPGLTVEERAAYELNFWERVLPLDPLDDDEQQRNPAHRRRSRNPRGDEPLPIDSDPVRHRLRESLSHAGAQLVDYLERSDSFRVYYRIGGRQYTSSVDKEDLTVQVAGICLSGEDRKFDLGSLVGVLREGERGGGIYEVGENGMTEEEYWDVHPKKPVIERCWVLLGCRQGPFWYARRQRPTSGEIASVKFDAAWVLDREEIKGDVVGFYHTHPKGSPNVSRRDVKTMHGWVESFGKPLLCIIESGDQLAAYRFNNDRSRSYPLAACELFPRGIVIAFEEDVENDE